ncbi:hypothetical protein BB559_000110 [Furculomyces boomerangus]|uniref:Uncharacterized protein n=2 Tax=Harpellales TaxID=61421 RepID=A0A2T9YD61_9FUNG|nr:hypothetical protein BB559_004704 [Furculomyces boomerangus]PVV00127.1 hypothetical protein BB559_000110 [Furculomyces boomerangus]PWA00562.1 hypothetical protein BB558_003370 [Smittium angustum]
MEENRCCKKKLSDIDMDDTEIDTNTEMNSKDIEMLDSSVTQNAVLVDDYLENPSSEGVGYDFFHWNNSLSKTFELKNYISKTGVADERTRHDSFLNFDCKDENHSSSYTKALVTKPKKEIAIELMLVNREWNLFIKSNGLWKQLFFKNKEWVTKEIELCSKPKEVYNDPNSIRNSEFVSLLENKQSNEKKVGQKFFKKGNSILIPKKVIRRLNEIATNIQVKRASQSYQTPFFLTPPNKQITPEKLYTKDVYYINNESLDKRIEGKINNGINNQIKVIQTPNWGNLYKSFYKLENRWKKGTAKLCTLIGHQDSIYCLQFDKDKIITGSRDKTIKIWDTKSLICNKVLAGHSASVLCLKYRDNILASGSSDTTIILWNLAEERKLFQLYGHSAGVLDVTINDDYIISCSKDCSIKVWDRNTGSLINTLYGHTGPVNALSLVENTLVSASGDSSIRVWDLSTFSCTKVLRGHLRGLACIQFDGKRIVSGSNDRTIKVWDIQTGKCIQTLVGHTDLVRTLYYQGGSRAVSGSYDQTVKVWDLESGSILLDFKDPHTSWVFDVQSSMGRIISTTQDQKINIWDFGEDLGLENYIN